MSADPQASALERSVEITAGRAALAGDLVVPPDAAGIVLFAHGSGSGRGSPRNRAVAVHLREAGLATLLIDLLTPDEEREDRETGRRRFDVTLLGERAIAAIDWIAHDRAIGGLTVGCFGGSTGAAAALIAAAERSNRVAAVVSRGGRPDLAGAVLERVTAPTLLIVGGRDTDVLELNREAASRLRSPRLEMVPGASHLFEEPDALEQVATLARQWFTRHLTGGGEVS